MPKVYNAEKSRLREVDEDDEEEAVEGAFLASHADKSAILLSALCCRRSALQLLIIRVLLANLMHVPKLTAYRAFIELQLSLSLTLSNAPHMYMRQCRNSLIGWRVDIPAGPILGWIESSRDRVLDFLDANMTSVDDVS